MPPLDRRRPENAGVLRYLERVGAGPETDPHPDDADRYHLGTHPDIVAHLWDTLASAFDGDSRAVIHGTPALADPLTGVVVALGLGTTYALLLGPDDAAAVIATGGSTVHVYRSVGRTLDLASELGPGWVFGSWRDDEAECLKRTAALL
jgi:hypothetical protein